MYEDPVRCFGGIATPRRPPAGLTLAPLTRKATPLTFTRRPLTNGLFHMVVIGQPIGTCQNKVWAQPTTRFPPCRPDVAVSPLEVPAAVPSVKGVTLQSRVPGVCTCQHNRRNNLMDVDIKFVSFGQGMKNIQKSQNKRVFSVNLKQT